jgi:N-methylhydantoinase B
LNGGFAGGCGRFLINPDTPEQKVVASKVSNIIVQEGDVISVQTAGGGGYGSPLERNPEQVAYDFLLGKESIQKARDQYGVVITEGGEVDEESTANLRGRISAKKEQ